MSQARLKSAFICSISILSVSLCAVVFLIPSKALAEISAAESPIPAVAGPDALLTLSAPNLGDLTTFNVDAAYDIKNRSTLTAVHQFTGQRAYVFIDSAYLNGLTTEERAAFLDQAKLLLDEFDQRIYPIVTQTFGSPWEPGIDNDIRITILINQLSEQTAGYFNPRDEFEKAHIPESNEREMIYLNTRFIAGGRAKMFLAHEFQHLISFYWKDKLLGETDDVWLNEARSEYIPTLLGYDTTYNGSNLEHRVSTFLRNPNDSLTEWRNTPADYGSVALFGQYLADQYSANVFKEMMRARSVGFASIEESLRAVGKPATFKDVFTNWTVANYYNNISEDIRYGYLNSLLRGFRLAANDLPVMPVSETTFTAKDWTNNAFRFFGAQNGSLSIALNATDIPSAYRMSVVRIEPGKSSVISRDDASSGIQIAVPLSVNTTYLVIPFSHLTVNSFKESDPSRTFTLRVAASDAPAPTLQPVPDIVVPKYPEGSLIRARGDFKVYITKGPFARHIVSPDIFGFYGHLGFAKVIDISPEELAQYKLSAWVRADGDPRVWEINGDGIKHWINIAGEQFAPSGRDWNGVYIINSRERDWYIKGVDVMK